jgi:hypothetical protein
VGHDGEGNRHLGPCDKLMYGSILPVIFTHGQQAPGPRDPRFWGGEVKGTHACRYSVGLARPRGSKPRSPGKLPSNHAGRVVLGSHRPSSAIPAVTKFSIEYLD